jgi:hypothetical protein
VLTALYPTALPAVQEQVQADPQVALPAPAVPAAPVGPIAPLRSMTHAT